MMSVIKAMSSFWVYADAESVNKDTLGCRLQYLLIHGPLSPHEERKKPHEVLDNTF